MREDRGLHQGVEREREGDSPASLPPESAAAAGAVLGPGRAPPGVAGCPARVRGVTVLLRAGEPGVAICILLLPRCAWLRQNHPCFRVSDT